MTKPRNFDEVLAKVPDARQGANGEWTGSCPCPGHKTPKGHLSLKDGGDRVLVYCHPDGKHSEAEIMAMWAYTSLKYDTGKGKKRDTEKVYPYVDVNGELLFEVVRTRPKGFYQRQPDGKGGHKHNLDGITPVLYRLDKVTEAVVDGETIYVVEGEKDADKLWGAGIAATTNPMGAGKWHDHYAETLCGADVVIIPDNDNPGLDHALKVGASCQARAASVRILRLDEKDVTDWMNAGHKASELKVLADQAPAYHPGIFDQDRPRPSYVPAFATNTTDLGNAERMVALHGDKLRYCIEKKEWLLWTGKVWRWDTGGHKVWEIASEVMRQVYREAADEHDDKRRKELVDHAKRSENKDRVRAMIDMAPNVSREGQNIRVWMDDLDANPWLFNVLNGTIDLRTGELRPHNKADMNTIIVPIEYDQDTECDLWLSSIHLAMAGNAELVTYLQRCVGYSLTGNTDEQAWWFLYGTGENGKSTFMDTIRAIMGDYGGRLDIGELMVRDPRQAAAPRPGLAGLKGKRFVATTESRQGGHMDTGRIKDLTGGDSISVRNVFEKPFEFTPVAKFWMLGNHKPVVTDNTWAQWRRTKLVPFMVKIRDRDPGFKHRLKPEYPGILAWAVKGCLEWQREGLGEPQDVTRATEAYRHEQDVLGDFIEDRCVLGVGGRATKAELRREYESWCQDNGAEPVKQRTFKARLAERDIGEDRTTDNRTRVWTGIRLKQPLDIAETGDNPDNSDNSDSILHKVST